MMSLFDPALLADLDVYRVQQRWVYHLGRPPTVIPRHFWNRTFQAEWPDCQRVVRAYTRNGVIRKACKARQEHTR